MKQKIITIFLAGFVCFFLVLAVANGAEQIKVTGNERGIHGGYDYELWKDEGNVRMILKDAGAFSCEWDNINNVLFRKGKKFDSTKTHSEIGEFLLSYDCEYNPKGNSYLCVYGWTRDPLVEFYVVDSWGSWRPPGGVSKGSFSVDGGTYDVYVTTRIDKPSIEGNTTFKQYWSVRKEKRTSGTISVSEHFRKWESMDMPMGKMYEVAFTVEGFQSSGTADVKNNVLTINGNALTEPVYQITYNLSGGKNHKSNPKTYQASNSYQLKEPSRKGYLFKGWYMDYTCVVKLKSNKIDPRLTGNLDLYAKWKKLNVPKVKVRKITKQKAKKFKIELRRSDNGMEGYEFAYTTDSKFTKAKTKIRRTRLPSVMVKGLSKGKSYYVRSRAYDLDSAGKKVYGKWSVVRRLKT